MSIKYTGGTWNVLVAGSVVSSGHFQEKEALEKAANLALQGETGVTVEHGPIRVESTQVASEPEPEPEPTPEPEPDEPPAEPATVDSPFVQFAEGEKASSDGATWEFYNRGAGLAWEKPGGDWTDRDGVRHGPEPFASGVYESDVVEIDVTNLVQGWINGNFINQGLMLRTEVGGVLRMASKDNDNPDMHPALVIDGTAIKPDADTTLTDASVDSVGHSQTISLASDQPVLMRFTLPEVAEKAILRLRVVKAFSAAGMKIDVYRCTPPAFTEGTAETGIAAGSLDGHGSVIYRNRFDDPDTWKDGLGGKWRGNEVIENARLKLTLLPEGGGGLNVHYNFTGNGLNEPVECYARYYLEISSQWFPTQGGKLPGFAGISGGYGFGGGRPDGTNGWSNRGRYWLRPPPSNPMHDYIRIGNYTYHPDMEGLYGDARTWGRHAAGYLEFDREYAIETYVKLNTVGEHDGVIRGWVDGVLAYERTGLMFRTVDDLKIETLWLNVFHGGTGDPEKESVVYLRDLVIAREYIGPNGDGNTQPEPLPEDATTTEILAGLEPGQGSMLPAFSVTGPDEGLAMHGKFPTRGPGRRDYCNKWVWAPDRSTALYCGGNHGAPHKFNDVWEFDLAANTWRMLQPPEEGVETLHTWWQLTWDTKRNRLLWMATGSLQTWPLSDSVTPPLVSWTPENGWEAVDTSPGISTTNGAALIYVPDRDVVIAHNQNWNGSGTQQLDPATGEWTQLATLDETYFSDGVSPGTEAIINYDSVNGVLVGFLENSVYVFDFSTWRRVRSDIPISVHDAGTASDFGGGVHWLHGEDRLFTYDYASDALTEYDVPELGGSMGYFDPQYGVFVLYNGESTFVLKDEGA